MNHPQQNYQPFLIPQVETIQPRPVPASALMIILAILSWIFSAFCAISFLAYSTMVTDGSRMDEMGRSIVQNQCLVGGFLALLLGFVLFRLRRG